MLITQRSVVQIHPPLPNKKGSRERALRVFWRTIAHRWSGPTQPLSTTQMTVFCISASLGKGVRMPASGSKDLFSKQEKNCSQKTEVEPYIIGAQFFFLGEQRE